MINIKSEGILLVLSSPSGAGKTTIAKALCRNDTNTNLSISCTTRAIRPGEIDGKDYHFIDHDSFLNMVAQNKFLEYAIIYDCLYGTPRDKITELVCSGNDVVFDIDWQGAASLKKQLPNNVVSIFILPPSLEILKKRLESRSSDNVTEIDKRFKEAIHEISHYVDYDFIVINDNLNEAIEEVHNILKSERLRRKRRIGVSSFIETM